MPMIAFDVAYSRTNENAGARVSEDGLEETMEVRQLIGEYGGTSYEEGLYRIFNAEDANRWTKTIRRFYPAESNGVEAFGRDWQGNVFGYRGEGARGVFLFQPGTGEVFEVAESMERFHNEELTEHAEEALSLSLWKEWRSHSPAPSVTHCVAYKKPVFLGGDVSVENLMIADIDVYWEVMGQLLEQVRDLPEGISVKSVKLGYLN